MLLRRDDHPDAERLLVEARVGMPSLSVDTVYRTLNLFVEAGVIQRMAVPTRRARLTDAPTRTTISCVRTARPFRTSRARQNGRRRFLRRSAPAASVGCADRLCRRLPALRRAEKITALQGLEDQTKRRDMFAIGSVLSCGAVSNGWLRRAGVEVSTDLVTWRTEYVSAPTASGWTAYETAPFMAGPGGQTEVRVPRNSRSRAFFRIRRVE
jgi:hypothetical protein